MSRVLVTLQCSARHAAAFEADPVKDKAAIREWVAYQRAQHAHKFPTCRGKLEYSIEPSKGVEFYKREREKP